MVDDLALVANFTNASNTTNQTDMNYTYSWNWWECPDVDECKSAVDKCGTNATCHNEDNRMWNASDNGYHCTCHPDFRLQTDGFTCNPRCDKFGCVHGTCVKRDDCACNLGFYGKNCSFDCGCNQHSTCSEGPGRCDLCQNNTFGDVCELFLPGFHGNGTQGTGPYNGHCKPCIDVCNGHSTDCNQHVGDPGPVCRNCTNNTHGEYCEKCTAGFFLDPDLQSAAHQACKEGEITGKLSEGEVWPKCTENYVQDKLEVHSKCVPCQCNGHASLCDGTTGEGCNCQNNTVTNDDETCKNERKANGSCYNLQCSSCI